MESLLDLDLREVNGHIEIRFAVVTLELKRNRELLKWLGELEGEGFLGTFLLFGR